MFSSRTTCACACPGLEFRRDKPYIYSTNSLKNRNPQIATSATPKIYKFITIIVAFPVPQHRKMRVKKKRRKLTLSKWNYTQRVKTFSS